MIATDVSSVGLNLNSFRISARLSNGGGVIEFSGHATNVLNFY